MFHQRDFWVSLGFVFTNVAAHLLWNRIDVYWQFVATAVVLALFLAWWLAREWRRLKFAMTKFYCAAAAFDLIAEGALQHVHKCTPDNILCTGRMWLVFFAGWIVTVGWNWYRSRPAMAPTSAPPTAS